MGLWKSTHVRRLVNLPCIYKQTRGEEWAEMVKPRHKKVRILGLGYSVGTQNKTIEAPIVVVKTYEELEQRAAEVKNKIVVYNFEWEAYEKQAKYREYGAAHAAKHGAIAALIRSLASLSIDSPHTGGQSMGVFGGLRFLH